ncbi:spen family transcriptional repressor split ends isoform X2 [Dermacentor variabilis]|uniref:spen family transcriptional repressor split ends isoform X2 n=1 Tax=Dermacentor variabilis TaxID=34621 RepID=UPI003F5C7294
MVRETRHLWVGNLPDNIREERIREHFKRYGKVQSVKIRRDADGVCATVSFIDLRSAAKAHVAENKLDDRLLKTEYYEPAAATLFSHDDGAAGASSSSASAAAASRVAPSALVAPGGTVGAGGGGSALVGPGCPPSAAVAPPGAPYAPQGPARNPRFVDERGYYYDRTGDRDPYVRRTTGYHDEDSYQSRGRSRDRYARSAASNASAYQDGTDRCQASSILPGQYGSGSHFRSHGVSPRQPAPLPQSSHFDPQGGYGLSPAGEPYPDEKDSGSPSAARGGLASRRGSAVSSTVTSPPQQPQLQSQTQQRCHNKHGSRSQSRSRSSSRSSSCSRLGSSSSKIRSSSSDSSCRSLSPNKSPTHHSSSSTKASRGERPASAVTAPSSSSFLQSTISTPNTSSTNANNGSSSSGNCLQNNNSLDGSTLGDREDKRPLGICVRNLPVRSTDTSLKDGLFHEYKKHGKVTVVKVIGQGTERYAVVCFKKPEDVEKALEVSKDKLFFGCKIEVTSHEGLDGEDNEFRPLEAELDEYHPKATRTLFIGNLEKDITTTELRKHFDQFGDIIEIDIKKQGSASSYAFIQYADIASVVKAMRKLDGENLGANRIKLGFGKSMPTMCVWLDGVTDLVSDKFLSRTFGRYGPVSFAAIDRERGHALVYFDSLECAQHAVAEMRGRVLGGKKLQVDFASRECQTAFFDKIEMSGQVLQGERPWERRDRRQEFDVIRDERFPRDSRGVTFDGRGYSRYEAQQRSAGRGPFRGLQRGGTYNSRGRGQPFQGRYDSGVYHDEFGERRHRFPDKEDGLEDITPYDERAERLKHIDGVLGTADWAPRKTSSSIKKHRNSTSDQESHHSQSPPQSRHHSRSPPPSVKGSKKGSSKERPSQRHRLSPGRSSSRSPVVRDVALDSDDMLVDVRDIRRRSLDSTLKSDSKELPLASVCSKLEAFQDSGAERIRSSSSSSSRMRRDEDVNSTSDSPSQLERKRRLLGLKESSSGSRPEDSRSDTDCAEGDEELSVRSDSKYLSKQVQDILSSSDGECSPCTDGAARKKGKGLPTDTCAVASRSRPAKDIPSVVSKRLPTNCRTAGSFEAKFSVEVPSVRVGELLQSSRKQVDPRRQLDHNKVSSTVSSYLRAKKVHSDKLDLCVGGDRSKMCDPSLVSSTDSEMGSQDASLLAHLAHRHGEEGIDEVSSSSDNPQPPVRTRPFRESSPLSLPLPKFAAALRSPKASPCVAASPMANSQSPHGNCSPLSALNTKNGPVFPEALARPEKPVEEKPAEVIPPESVPEALSPSPSPKGLKGPSDSKLPESSSDSESSLPSPNRPSFDEQIRALDERYNALTGPTRTFTGPSMAGCTVETPAPVTIDYNKYNIKKRPRFPALSQEFRTEPSEIMKTLLAKTTILDQDSKRLEHINEKYEPKDVKLDLCSSSAKPLFRTKAAAKEFSTPLSLPSLGFSSCAPATSTALPQGASSPSFTHASTAAPGASPSQTVPNCPSQCTTSQTLAAPAPLAAPEPHPKHVPLMVATPYNDVPPTRTVPPSILRRDSSPPCAVKQEPFQSPPRNPTPLSPPAAVVVKKEVMSPRASSLLRRDSSPPVVVKQEPFQSPPRTPAPPLPLAVKKEPGLENIPTRKDSRNRETCTVKLEPAAVKEVSVKKEAHKDSSTKKESRKEYQSSSSKNILREHHATSDASCNSVSHKERRDSHSHDSSDLPAPLPLAAVKQRVSSIDSNESDSAKSSRSSDAYLEVPPEATWNRSEDERRSIEPEAKRPKLSHSSRERDSFDKSHSSSKSSSSHSKKSEKRLEKSSSSSSSSFKSERTEKSHSSHSSKNESGDKQDMKSSSESKRDSSKSKEDKKSSKSRDSREKSRDRPKEKESSKEKGQDSKHGSSSGSHTRTSSSSSKQRKEHGSDRSEKDKSRSEKRTSSTSEQSRDSKSKSKSKSESHSASAPQASDFCFLDDEPVYFSMYDKVKARSSQNQTLKDQANMETMRQKFSRLKQSRAKKGKSADMDSDRDSDLSSHHSSDSETKSRVPSHKSKQLTKKRKLVIESSSDENEQSFAMRLLHNKNDDSSDFCSDSEMESYKEAFNKCEERKVDISDVETSDSDEPSHIMAASRKQKRKQRHSSEKSTKSRHGKSDIESSDADISRSLKRKELKKKAMRKPSILKSDAEGSDDECHPKTDEGKSVKQRLSRQEDIRDKSDISHTKETVSHRSRSSSKSKRPSKDTDESKHEEDSELSRQRHSSKKRKKSKKSSKLKEKKSTEKSSSSSLAAPSQKRSDTHWDVGEMLDESSVSSKYIGSPKQTLNSPPVLQPSIFSDVEMKSELSDYDFEASSKPTEKLKDRNPEASWDSKHNVAVEFSPVKEIKQEREEAASAKRESDSELDKIVDALTEAVEPRGPAVQEFPATDKKEEYEMDRLPYDDVTCDVPSTRHLSEDDDKESSSRQDDGKSKEHRKKKKQSKEKKRKHKEDVVLQSSPVREPIEEPAPAFPAALDEDSKLTEDIRLDEDIAEEARRLEEELLAQSEETSTFGDGDNVLRREEKPLQAERHFEEEAAKETKRLEEELFSSGRDSWHMKDEKVYDDVAPQKEPKTDVLDVSSAKDSSYSSLVATEELPSRHSESPHYLSHDVPEQFKIDDKEQNTYELDSPRKMEDDLAVYALLQEMGNDGISAPELPKEPDYLDPMVQHHQQQHEESMSFLLPDESSSSLQIDTSMPDLTQEESRESGGALEFTDALQSLQQPQQQPQPPQQQQQLQHQQEQPQSEQHEALLEKTAEGPIEESSTCENAEEEPVKDVTSEPPLLIDAKEPEPSMVPPKELPDLTRAALQPEGHTTSTEESDIAGTTAAKPEKQRLKRKRRRSSRAESASQRLLSDTDEEHQFVGDKRYEQPEESLPADPYQPVKEEPRPSLTESTLLPSTEESVEEKPADVTKAPAEMLNDEPSTLPQHKALQVTKEEELNDAQTALASDVAAEPKEKAEDMEMVEENNEDTADSRPSSIHQAEVPIENDSSKDQEMFDDMSHRAPILDIIETLSSPVGTGDAQEGEQDEVVHQEADSSGEQLDNTLSAEETPAHSTEPTVAGTEGVKRKTGSRKGRKTKSRRASVPRLEAADAPKVPARRGRATSADKVRRCLRSDNIENTLSETEDAPTFPSGEVKNEVGSSEVESLQIGGEAQHHDEERLRLSFDSSTSKESTESSAAPATSLAGGHGTDNTLPEEKLGDFCMDPYKEEPKKRRGRKKKSSGEHHPGRVSPVLDKTSDLRSEEHDFKDTDKQKEQRPLFICTRQGTAVHEHKLTKGSTASAYDVYEFKDSEDEEDTQFGGTDWQVAPEKHLERHIEATPKTADHAIHDESKTHELRPAECPAFEGKLQESNAHDARLHETKTHELRSHDASRMHDIKSHDGKVHDSKTNETVKTYDTKAHDAKASDAKTNEVKVYEVKAHEVKAHESQHEKRHDESKHKAFHHEDKEASTKEYVTELSQHGKISITIRLHQKDGHDGSSSSTAEVVKTSEAVAGDDTRQEKVPPAKQEPSDAHQIKTRKSARLMSQANKTTIDETIEDVVKGHFKAPEDEGDLHSEGPMTRAARRTRSSRRNEEVSSKVEPEGAAEVTKTKNETPVLVIADNKVKDNIEENKPVAPVSAIVLPPPPAPPPPAVETLSSVTDAEHTSKPESKMSLRSFRFTRSAAKAEMSKDTGVKEEPTHEVEPSKEDLSLQQQSRPEATQAEALQATLTPPPTRPEQVAVKDEQKTKASAGLCETEDSDSRQSPTELIDPVTGFLTPVNKNGEPSVAAGAAVPAAASDSEALSRIVKPQSQQTASNVVESKPAPASSSVEASTPSWTIPPQSNAVGDTKAQLKEAKPPLELIQRPPVLAHAGAAKSHGILQGPVIHGRPAPQAVVTTMLPSELQKVSAAHMRPEAAVSKPSEMPVGPAVAAIKIPEQQAPSSMPISTSVPTGAMPAHFVGAKGLSLPPVGQPPVSLGQPPAVSLGQPSVSLGQPPVSLGQPSVSVGQPPVSVGQTPVSLCQPPVSLGQPSMSLGQPSLGVWVGARPPIGPQYPPSFTSLAGQQHLARGVHSSVVRTPSLPQQEAATKMPGPAHAMVGGPNSAQVHCNQPKMEGPPTQLPVAQQTHHHPQQHIQPHQSHPQQHSQLHVPSPHQQLLQQQQQHQVPQQQASQHKVSQHHHQALQPPQQQHQHQQQQQQQGPGLHPPHHPGEIKGVPVSVAQHLQSPPQQPHVVATSHIKAEGFAMPSQAVGRVGPASRTPPAPVPRQLTLVEGVVPSRSQGLPQQQGPAIMTQAPTKIHEPRTPVGSKGTMSGMQHAAKQAGGFLQPPFGGYEPSGMPGSSHAATGGSAGVTPPGGGVIAELLQNPHLMQQHKNYQLAVAASQYMGGGPLGRPGASLHVGGPGQSATPPQELLHLRPSPGQQLLVAGHLGMHTPDLSAYMHHQQMLYAAAQHPHYALPPEAQGLRFAYPPGGFRAPPEPRDGVTKESRPPPPLKGSDAEPTLAEGAPKDVPSKELLRPPFPPLRQTSPRVASSPQERVTDSPAVASPYGLRGAGHLGPTDKGPSSDEPPKPPAAHQGFHEPTGGLGGSPPFLHSPGGALALKKEADVAKKGVPFERRQTGLEAPLHHGPPPAHALAPPPAAPRSQPQTPPHASQVPPQGDSFLLQRYPVMWQGLLALKNDQAAVQMHFVSGNSRIAVASLPPMTDGCTPPVRIAQRMRLEQTQLEGVARKMQMLDEHCILLALPCGRDHMDVLQQSNNLRNGFINYLQLKQAAGIVNAAAPGSQQPAYVIHIFPSCEFSNENLARIAPDLLHSVSDIAHLLVIIATV